jgi:hypothetical protein
MVNVTEECRCGNKKSIYKQWCDVCWDKVPIRVARNLASRSLALARQIETCDRYIKEYDKEQASRLPLDTSIEGVHSKEADES